MCAQGSVQVLNVPWTFASRSKLPRPPAPDQPPAEVSVTLAVNFGPRAHSQSAELGEGSSVSLHQDLCWKQNLSLRVFTLSVICEFLIIFLMTSAESSQMLLKFYWIKLEKLILFLVFYFSV